MFSLFFGPQVDLFIGVAVGYLYVYGMLKFLEIGSAKAKLLENKFPFANFSSRPDFVRVDGAAGDSSLPTFIRAAPPSGSSQ
jgi:hypothetical protein